MKRTIALTVLTVVLAGCSGSGGGATAARPSTTQAAAAGTIDGQFDVGGHKLHLRCQGTSSPGSPTLVYLHGLGGDGSDVGSIQGRLTGKLRV
jgi:poly(3-hydroxybutyrate) depolymerase